MRVIEYLVNFCAILSIGYLKLTLANTDIYVCEADDAKYLGTYTLNKEKMDGVQTFSNANDLSFFRNKGFWYLGNLAPWPPETVYRCVEQEGCNYMKTVPPTSEQGAWKPSQKFDKGTFPKIQTTPCASAAEEL